PQSENELQDEAEPEDRDILRTGGEDAGPEIGGPIAAGPGERAQADPKHARHDHRGNRELERGGHSILDFLDHRFARHDGRPHVPGEDATQVREILDIERIVQAQLPLYLVDDLGIPFLAVDRAHGVTRRNPKQEKRERQEDQEHGNHQQDAGDHVGRSEADDPAKWFSSLLMEKGRKGKKVGVSSRPTHETLIVKYRKNWIGSSTIPETVGLNTTVCFVCQSGMYGTSAASPDWMSPNRLARWVGSAVAACASIFVSIDALWYQFPKDALPPEAQWRNGKT